MKKRKRKSYRDRLPEALRLADTVIPLRGRKIPHAEILRAIQKRAGPSGDLVEIYRENVLPQNTRTMRLLGKKSTATIIHTLLGYEVQAGYKRIHCPDLVTARYLRLFSGIGCHSIKLPYDPTVTARWIPAMEAAMEQIHKSVRELFPADPAVQRYVIQNIYAILRRRLRFS